MAIKIDGLYETEAMLVNLDDKVKGRSLRRLRRAGRDIQKLAKRMAPRDTGALEEAIKYAEEGSGPHGKIEVTVYVDSDEVNPKTGAPVGDYAYEVHEHMMPMGDAPLGIGSSIKQTLNPDVEVGGGFLERAADEVERHLEGQLHDDLSDL